MHARFVEELNAAQEEMERRNKTQARLRGGQGMPYTLQMPGKSEQCEFQAFVSQQHHLDSSELRRILFVPISLLPNGSFEYMHAGIDTSLGDPTFLVSFRGIPTSVAI